VILTFVTHARFSRPPTLASYPQYIHKGGLDTYRDNSVLCASKFTGRLFWPSPNIGVLTMTISRFTPPLDYLQAASRSSLQSFELTRLNHAANLRQEIGALIDQWIQDTSEALLARWMLDHHQFLQSPPMAPTEVVRTLIDPSASLFPESGSEMSGIVPAPPRFSDSRTPIKSSIPRKLQKQRHSAAG
jgi:hypothetical protein